MNNVSYRMPLTRYLFLRNCVCVSVCVVCSLPWSFLFCLWHLCPCSGASVLSLHFSDILKFLLPPGHLSYALRCVTASPIKITNNKQHSNSKNVLVSHIPLKLPNPLFPANNNFYPKNVSASSLHVHTLYFLSGDSTLASVPTTQLCLLLLKSQMTSLHVSKPKGLFFSSPYLSSFCLLEIVSSGFYSYKHSWFSSYLSSHSIQSPLETYLTQSTF